MPELPLPPERGQLLPEPQVLELKLLPVNVHKMPTIERLLRLGVPLNWPDSEQLLQRGLPQLDKGNSKHWQEREQLLQRGLPLRRRDSK